jgi:hypothetical protein
MITQLYVFALILTLGGLLYYPFHYTLQKMIEAAETAAPAFVTGLPVTFLKAVDYWMPLLVFILPGLIWFFVNIQRPRQYE